MHLKNKILYGEKKKEVTEKPSYSLEFTSILSYFRTPPSSSTSIPLTGDSQADADILAFIKARQNILQKKGKLAKI